MEALAIRLGMTLEALLQSTYLIGAMQPSGCFLYLFYDGPPADGAGMLLQLSRQQDRPPKISTLCEYVPAWRPVRIYLDVETYHLSIEEGPRRSDTVKANPKCFGHPYA